MEQQHFSRLDDEKYRYDRARARVKDLKEFYAHLAAYILVNAFIVGINLYFVPDSYFFQYALGGWGIGLGIHAFDVWLGKDWEDRKTRELMEREDF